MTRRIAGHQYACNIMSIVITYDQLLVQSPMSLSKRMEDAGCLVVSIGHATSLYGTRIDGVDSTFLSKCLMSLYN